MKGLSKKITSDRDQIRFLVKRFYLGLSKKFGCRGGVSFRRVICENLVYGGRSGDFEPNKELSSVIKSSGLFYVGTGASRLVLGYKNFAIKVEKGNFEECDDGVVSYESDSAISSNEIELRAYAELIKNDVCRLCIVPIIDHFGRRGREVLIFPLLESLSSLPSNYSNSMSLYNKRKGSLIYLLFADPGRSNMGLYKGEVFYLDYNVDDDMERLWCSYQQDAFYARQLKKSLKLFSKHKKKIANTKRYIEEMKELL